MLLLYQNHAKRLQNWQKIAFVANGGGRPVQQTVSLSWEFMGIMFISRHISITRLKLCFVQTEIYVDYIT